MGETGLPCYSPASIHPLRPQFHREEGSQSLGNMPNRTESSRDWK